MPEGKINPAIRKLTAKAYIRWSLQQARSQVSAEKINRCANLELIIREIRKTCDKGLFDVYFMTAVKRRWSVVRPGSTLEGLFPHFFA